MCIGLQDGVTKNTGPFADVKKVKTRDDGTLELAMEDILGDKHNGNTFSQTRSQPL